jgi:Histidine kinase-, DNA gyrase B-, and HSP90-like ATPase
VLVNLINNARDAGCHSISVAASTVEREGRPLVRIAVEASGPGIAPDVLSRLFVGFVTIKARGKGTGLGLRICRHIVEEMDGSISASNGAEGGACFEILLPTAAGPSSVEWVVIVLQQLRRRDVERVPHQRHHAMRAAAWSASSEVSDLMRFLTTSFLPRGCLPLNASERWSLRISAGAKPCRHAFAPDHEPGRLRSPP